MYTANSSTNQSIETNDTEYEVKGNDVRPQGDADDENYITFESEGPSIDSGEYESPLRRDATYINTKDRNALVQGRNDQEDSEDTLVKSPLKRDPTYENYVSEKKATRFSSPQSVTAEEKQNTLDDTGRNLEVKGKGSDVYSLPYEEITIGGSASMGDAKNVISHGGSDGIYENKNVLSRNFKYEVTQDEYEAGSNVDKNNIESEISTKTGLPFEHKRNQNTDGDNTNVVESDYVVNETAEEEREYVITEQECDYVVTDDQHQDGKVGGNTKGHRDSEIYSIPDSLI